MSRLPLAFLCIFSMQTLQGKAMIAESDTLGTNKSRLAVVIVGGGALYAGSLVVLNDMWYKEQGKSSFHFYNDNNQWNQVDKAGHFYTAYQLSSIGKQLFRWTNMSEKKSAIWGSVMSQALMVPIEVLDGHSAEYGFSWGDILANLAGTGVFLSQELSMGKQKIKPKFSVHTTRYAALRPEVLGKTLTEQLLKDYNGHTYWLSFDIFALSGENTKIPKMLNLAIGYGAEEMVYGTESDNNANGFYSYRQFYLGLDIDLSHIRTKNKLLKSLIFVADMIKLPAPALEFNMNNGMNFYWLYF
jgi:uncharacterized protein YfiM (DUF2279 family)